MGSLDDKLSDILDDWYPGAMYEDVVPKIKQVFIDKGWVDVTKGASTWQVIETPTEKRVLMSGQEWYDALMKEFTKINRIYTSPDVLDGFVAKFTDFVDAAKKASGLVEEEE